MIFRRMLHIEWHRGHALRVSLRRPARSGDVVWNGDILCVLDRCDPCGEGFIARELSPRVERRGGLPRRRMQGAIAPVPLSLAPSDASP